MIKLTTVIIDDEEDNRQMLKSFLFRYCPHVLIAGEAASVEEASALINQVHPQLIFLDINMPRQSGFELFNEVDGTTFHTIFVTAHDDFAMKAFQLHAVDYLLKPLNIQSLILAVTRVTSLVQATFGSKSLNDIIQAFNRKSFQEKIALPVTDGYIYVPVHDIIRCEAEGSYTSIYFINREKLLVSRNIGSFEGWLKKHNFFRVHHQHLINPDHVVKYQRGRGGTVFMVDNMELPVSQRKRDEFLHYLGRESGLSSDDTY